ncbi:hypothetical protein JCM9279_005563 [Rhodotorula babjevae]
MYTPSTVLKKVPAPDMQPCEVCGTSTRRCCAACRAAGLNIFFCSKAHQKLVWPAHKPVCGPGKAFPMAVLPLTDLELKAAHHRLDKVAFPEQLLSKSLRAELRETGGKAAEVRTLLLLLVVETRSAALTPRTSQLVLADLGGDVYDTSKLSAKPWLVHMVRTAVRFYAARGEVDKKDKLAVELFHLYYMGEGRSQPGGIFEESRVSYLVTVLRSFLYTWGALRDDQPRELWFSLLSHKILLFGHLTRLSEASLEALEARTLAAGARSRFDDWIRGGMGTDDPRLIGALRFWSK